ncbi:MAG: SPOR domain-containing protein [Blastocatellia bacterium]
MHAIFLGRFHDNVFFWCASLMALFCLLGATEAAATSRFTLQLAACETAAEAKGLVAQWQQHDIPAEVATSAVLGQRFRVRAGNFATVTAAREQGEQWRAAGWVQSYWIAPLPSSIVAKAAVTAPDATRKRVVTAEKSAPDLSLGELLQALSDKWAVRVPENLALYSARVVFPQAGVIRPAVVLLNEAQLRSFATPVVKHKELLHPLELRGEPGIRNSPTADSMKFTEAEQLAASLRSISGFQDLTFDERGVLVLGARITGGSELARTLLRAALESKAAIEIESLAGSDLVVFGAYINASFKNAEGKTAQISKIQLDFRDFAELRGDARLLSAFDPGFVFLHELAHGIWDLPDDERGGLGECETFINQVRRQLGLPERLTYFYKIRRQPGGSEWGEMMFTQPIEGTRRREALKLLWDNRAVNGVMRK